MRRLSRRSAALAAAVKERAKPVYSWSFETSQGRRLGRQEGLLRLVADKRNRDDQWWVDYRGVPNDAAAIKGGAPLRLLAN